MKKFAAFMLTIIMAFLLFIPAAFAVPEFDKGDIKAESYMLIDVHGNVLVEYKPDKEIYPASTTKIMTAILVLEKGNLEDTVTIGKEIDEFGSRSSLLFLKKGEKVKTKDLLYGMWMVSGNDAAASLAKSVGGSVEKFVEMMNEKAEALGMKNTKFVNPEGRNKEGHHTTAEDMAKLISYALQNAEFRNLFETQKYEMPDTMKDSRARGTKHSTNKLISQKDDKIKQYNYGYAKGGKTGSILLNDKDYNCLVANAKKDDTELIVLLFGDRTSDGNGRWVSSEKLFDYGLSNYQTVDLKDYLTALTVTKEIQNASEEDENGGVMEFGPTLEESFYYTGTVDEIQSFTSNSTGITPIVEFTSEEIQAPIKKGTEYGTISYKSGDEVLYQGPLYATRDMAALGDEPVSATTEPKGSSPVNTLNPAKIDPGLQISPWWWLLLPALLGGFIILRVLTMNRKRKSRFRSKRKVYNYRIR